METLIDFILAISALLLGASSFIIALSLCKAMSKKQPEQHKKKQNDN